MSYHHWIWIAEETRHIQSAWWHGYRLLEVSGGQHAFVATPEKALLDWVYLQPEADRPEALGELRLQNLHELDLDRLAGGAERAHSPKLQRAAAWVRELAAARPEEYESV